MAENEDIDYRVNDFAVAEPERAVTTDDDSANNTLIRLRKDIEADIREHNSFDVLNLPANATDEQKIAVFNEIAIHKGLALKLQAYKETITNAIKEIK